MWRHAHRPSFHLYTHYDTHTHTHRERERVIRNKKGDDKTIINEEMTQETLSLYMCVCVLMFKKEREWGKEEWD